MPYFGPSLNAATGGKAERGKMDSKFEFVAIFLNFEFRMISFILRSLFFNNFEKIEVGSKRSLK